MERFLKDTERLLYRRVDGDSETGETMTGADQLAEVGGLLAGEVAEAEVGSNEQT